MQEAYQRYLIDLIRIPSLTGAEGDCAAYVLESLKALGADSWIDEAGNVAAELDCGPGPVVLLNTHLDVVPAGEDEAWKPYRPFGGDTEGDLVIGRGAADVKGGLAAQFFAFKHFKEALDAGRRFKGTLIFSAVVHEEAAEMLGMRVLIEETLARRGRKVDLCILGEPTGGKIALGQRGKVELVVTTRGKTAHSSEPLQGINALEKMLPVMAFVSGELSARLKAAGTSAAITDCVVKPGRQSVIPDYCEISIDRRYYRQNFNREGEEELPALTAEIEEFLETLRKNDPDFHAVAAPRSYMERTWTGYEKTVLKYHPPWTTPEDQPLVQQALAALDRAGLKTETIHWKFGTDGSLCAALHGIPTIGYSHADPAQAHQSRERVSVPAMQKTIAGTIAMAQAVWQ